MFRKQQEEQMGSNDGMNYAPVGKPKPVVKPGEFVIAAIALDHGHIYGMCNGLVEAGATLKWVYDPDPAKVEQFVKTYPGVKAAASEEEILSDPEVKLVQDEYQVDCITCAPADFDATFAEYMSKLEDTGIQTIIDERTAYYGVN